MLMIHADPLGTTSLLCTTSTVDDTVRDEDARMTTITGLATSLTLSATRDPSRTIYIANHYVDSLSDQELEQMSAQLEKKEEDWILQGKIQAPVEKPIQKVKQI
ncbi:MAG: hypothetical protein J6X28_02360 [Bacilli bacterium]|nr:hypothetical protein [Bacilli bacterium]